MLTKRIGIDSGLLACFFFFKCSTGSAVSCSFNGLLCVLDAVCVLLDKMPPALSADRTD